MQNLSPKQKIFVEYLIANPTKPPIDAARAAKYKGNDNTLYQIAFKMVRSGKIKSELDRRNKELEQKTNITVEFIQKEHLRLMELCEKTGDKTNLTANLAHLGKTIAAYRDKLDTNITGNMSLSELTKAADKARQNKGL